VGPLVHDPEHLDPDVGAIGGAIEAAAERPDRALRAEPELSAALRVGLEVDSERLEARGVPPDRLRRDVEEQLLAAAQAAVDGVVGWGLRLRLAVGILLGIAGLRLAVGIWS
jgi:hypothetical protein